MKQLPLFDVGRRLVSWFAPGSPCGDCGHKTIPGTGGDREYFMVHDDVWQAAQPWNRWGGEIHFLCVGCLEQRLGRRLTPADFTDAPCNKECPWGDSVRLAERKLGMEKRDARGLERASGVAEPSKRRAPEHERRCPA